MKRSIFVIGIILLSLLVSSIFIVPRNNIYNNDNNTSATIDFSEMRYLAFGDSITDGSGLPDRSKAYPNMVAKILDCKVTNKGVGGSTFSYFSERNCIADDVVTFTNKYSTKYDIISVTGGTNDKSRSLNLGTISDTTTNSVYGSLNIIATTLIDKYPNSFIFFMTPIKNRDCHKLNDANYTLLDVCNAIKNVANKYNLPVLDMYNTSQFENVDCGMNNPNCDGVHPIQEFVTEYQAPQIAQFIKDNYNK